MLSVSVVSPPLSERGERSHRRSRRLARQHRHSQPLANVLLGVLDATLLFSRARLQPYSKGHSQACLLYAVQLDFARHSSHFHPAIPSYLKLQIETHSRRRQQLPMLVVLMAERQSPPFLDGFYSHRRSLLNMSLILSYNPVRWPYA